MKKGKNIVVVLIIVVVVSVISILGIFLADKLKKINYEDLNDSSVEENMDTIIIVPENMQNSEDKVEMEETIFISEEEMSALGITEASLSNMEIFSDTDVFNILLLGTDELTDNLSKNARADSIMLLSLDKENKSMKLVSLQRGMGVPVLEGPYKGQYDWLTHCFRYGGADLMLREVQECLRVDVNRYVRVNFDNFEAIVDAVGGVDIELTLMEAKGLNGEVRTNAYANHTMYEGMNHLDGHDALEYSRLRYIDSDWKRIERQRKVIQAVVHKAKGLSLLELNDVANTILPMINTNLTKTEILELVLFAPNIIGADIEQMSIPQKGTYGGMKGMGGRNLYAVDFEANAKILREFLYEE